MYLDAARFWISLDTIKVSVLPQIEYRFGTLLTQGKPCFDSFAVHFGDLGSFLPEKDFSILALAPGTRPKFPHLKSKRMETGDPRGPFLC